MHALRRLARPAVATAAVLVLSGCGGDDGGDDTAAFCGQGQRFDQVGENLNNATPEDLPRLLQDAADAFADADPPSQIADDWEVIAGSLQDFADAVGDVDLTTPEGTTQAQSAAQDFLEVAAGPEASDVQDFIRENCDAAA